MNVLDPKKRIQFLKDRFGEYIFYYLLYWKKEHQNLMIAKFKDRKLFELTNEEYILLFEYATDFDKKRMKKNE